MIPKKVGGKVIMTCTSCGLKDEKAEHTIMREEHRSSKKIEVIDSEKEQNLPLTKEICEKCGHNRAYYWLLQTRSADEAETKFLRCEKCNHTWRDYS